LLQTLLDIVYPVRCPICGEIVVPKERMICEGCKDKLVYITEPRCKRCSKPIEEEEREYCCDCERKAFHYEMGYALWVYNEAMQQSIAAFKYHSRKEYRNFYIHELLRLYSKALSKLSLDAIIPVPIHRSKYLERGYNQAELLAKGIGKALGRPVYSDLLLRNKKTLPQKQLSDIERLRNLSEAFEIGTKRLNTDMSSIKKVLLVDDIYTTGSTIEACSALLKSHGIEEVYFIVLCIGKGY
jgi:ComF family protein